MSKFPQATDKRCVNGVRPSVQSTLTSAQDLKDWMDVALRKNALSSTDKKIIENLVAIQISTLLDK